MQETYTFLPINESKLVIRRVIMGSIAFVALTTFFSVSRARAADEAEAFVRSDIDKSYAILNRDAPNRRVEFHALLLSIVDTRRIASLVRATPDLGDFRVSLLSRMESDDARDPRAPQSDESWEGNVRERCEHLRKGPD